MRGVVGSGVGTGERSTKGHGPVPSRLSGGREVALAGPLGTGGRRRRHGRATSGSSLHSRLARQSVTGEPPMAGGAGFGGAQLCHPRARGAAADC